MSLHPARTAGAAARPLNGAAPYFMPLDNSPQNVHGWYAQGTVLADDVSVS